MMMAVARVLVVLLLLLSTTKFSPKGGRDAVCAVNFPTKEITNNEHDQEVHRDVPDPPSDMTVTHPAPRELRITWRYDTEANIAARTRFEITITNLNVSGPEGVVEVTDLTEREYTFTADSARQCEVDIYKIEIKAVTRFGSSAALVASARLPPLPDVSTVSRTLNITLTANPDHIKLKVLWHHIDPCLSLHMDNRILKYIVHLENSTTFHHRQTAIVAAYREHNIGVIIPWWVFPQNAKLSVSVEAINRFGSFVTEPRYITTTHIQSVSLCFTNHWPIWNIKCHYVPNSNVRGCVYRVVSQCRTPVGLTHNVTGMINRENTEGANVRLGFCQYEYLSVAAYVWEADGNIGTFPVRTSGGCTAN